MTDKSRDNMKYIKLRRLLPVCLVIALIGFTACTKESDEVTSDADEAESIATDEAIIDDLFEDVDFISDEAASYEEENEEGRVEADDSALLADCVGLRGERRLEEGIYTKIITLDFQKGCQGPNGRERQGTMMITRIANSNESTYSVSTTFENFYLDGRKIEGTRTRVYTTPKLGVHQVDITLTGGKVTLEDGRIIQREGTFTKTWNRKSGEISVEGSASGVNRNGVAYSTTITSPLLYKQDCFSEGFFMAVQGNRTISRTNKADATIAYGEGECDKTVALTLNGESRTIELTLTKN